MYHQYVFTAHYLFIALLAILSLNMFYRRQHLSLSNQWFLRLCLSTLLLLSLEILSWYFESAPEAGYRRLHIIFKYIFYLSNLLVPISWLIYIDIKIFRSPERLRKLGYYSLFLLLGVLLLTVNLSTGWIYRITAENVYTSNFTGVIGFTSYLFFIILAPVFLIIRSRQKIDRDIFLAVILFTGLPLTGAVLQITTRSTLLVWNSVALAVVSVYIFLELSSLTCDPLTGLNNRKQIEEWLLFRTASSGKNRAPFTLIMIDLDDFKQINDRFGHEAGDQALIHFSHILKNSVKTRDQVSRFAGDEFLIALDSAGEESAELVIGRIRDRLSRFNSKGITPYTIVCSCGYAVYSPERYDNYAMAIKEADDKMYEEKRKRKEFIKRQLC